MELVTVIFFLSMGIQMLFFLAFLIVFFAKSNKKEKNRPTKTEPVSVVVCAHNEEKNLRILIPKLLAQHYPNFEVVVVEDRSTDGTLSYLEDIMRNDVRLNVETIQETPKGIQGKKHALTQGIHAASNEWILLTDADCQPCSRHWIHSMSTHFDSSTQFVLGYSPYIKEKGFLNTFIRFETLLTAIQYIGMAYLGRPYMGVGRNMVYRKSFFLKNNGFRSHQHVVGGDDDLFVNAFSSSQNVACQIGKEAIVYSYPHRSWKAFLVQKIRHLSVGKYYKMADKIMLGLFMTSMLVGWFLLIPSLYYGLNVSSILGIFLCRWVLFILLIHVSARTLGESFAAWKVPFLDLLYVGYYFVVGVVVAHTTKVVWKK